jgi:hypothetical protein
MLVKLGESLAVSSSDIRSPEMVLSNPEIEERFAKFARDLKTIAPKANDFLYFTATMMHAAESALLDAEGSLKKDAGGKDVTCHWVENGNSVKWVCSDPNIKPFKNNNGDIFPERELLAAYKKWVGKPLCLDHKSSSVDMIRGVIVDTYYDYSRKRIIALCALDKKNYPDLARKVSTGYATCVSMGTAVSRAVCTDCGTSATIESEFCPCMRNKTRYGEINFGLNPLELSIVVTGADPKATIRQVVAAVDSIAKYVSAKDQELNSSLDEDKLAECEKGLQIAFASLSEIKQKFSNLKETETHYQKSDVSPEEKKSEQEVALASLSEKIDNLSIKISQLLKTNEVSHMSEKQAFYLGGGGVNEPTPGQVKYPKEEADKIRDTEDKQMNGQKPFPDTGPITGMHPGYESFGETEEARKRRLRRLADEDARSMRRQAALEKAKQNLLTAKEAFYNGGGGVNEPTPGKPKYEKEEADKVRDNEDKQMQGQKPFPGVGAIDGLHPSPESADEKDELKRKEKYRRADLTARLTKGAWHVYDKGNLILTAEVKDFAGDSVSQRKAVATEEFGLNLLDKVASSGTHKAVAALKTAFVAGAPAPLPEAAPMGAPAPMDMPASEPADKGGSGDPAESVPELLDQLDNTASDLHKGFEALTDKSENQLGDLEKAAPAAFSPTVAGLLTYHKNLRQRIIDGMKYTIANINKSKRELAMIQDIEKLNVKTASDKGLHNLVSESVDEAKLRLAEAHSLISSFVDYHDGMENVMKKASYELKVKKAQDSYDRDPMSGDLAQRSAPSFLDTVKVNKPEEGHGESHKVPQTMDELMKQRGTAREDVLTPMLSDMTAESVRAPAAKAPVNAPSPQNSAAPAPVKPLTPTEQQFANMMAKKNDQHQAEDCSGSSESSAMDAKDSSESSMSDSNDLKMQPDGSLEGNPEEVGKAMKEMPKKADFDMNTLEGRTAYRRKLAEKAGVKFYGMLEDAHGKSGPTLPSISQNKPQDDGAKIETLEEVHKRMLEVATKKPQVKKAAEDIQRAVIAGELKVEDVDGLVALGVDKDAVAYWKNFWGQAKDKEAKEYASELTKEHYEAKLAHELSIHKVKLARSYELSYEMVRKGALENNKAAISRNVDSLAKYTDTAFEDMKNMIARLPEKQASTLPRVGMADESVVMPTAKMASQDDLVAEYSKLFNMPRKGFIG